MYTNGTIDCRCFSADPQVGCGTLQRHVQAVQKQVAQQSLWIHQNRMSSVFTASAANNRTDSNHSNMTPVNRADVQAMVGASRA